MLRVHVKFRQERSAADLAEVSVDRLARVALARVSGEWAHDVQRPSVDVHVRHERRATFPLAVPTVAEVHIVRRRREAVADGSAEASAFEWSVHRCIQTIAVRY